nr:hypothetical protein [Collimonas silvisoli]
MPDHEITMSEAETDLLERVRQQQGLASIQQAAEWLAKSRLRKQSRQISGRGRALYQVDRKPA